MGEQHHLKKIIMFCLNIQLSWEKHFQITFSLRICHIKCFLLHFPFYLIVSWARHNFWLLRRNEFVLSFYMLHNILFSKFLLCCYWRNFSDFLFLNCHHAIPLYRRQECCLLNGFIISLSTDLLVGSLLQFWYIWLF